MDKRIEERCGLPSGTLAFRFPWLVTRKADKWPAVGERGLKERVFLKEHDESSLERLKYESEMKPSGQTLSPATVTTYLHSMPWWLRLHKWLSGRRYLATRFLDRETPVVIIAHSFLDARRSRKLAECIEQDWFTSPALCRDAYEQILSKAPALVVVQLRRKNVCGCLGHRHVVVKERLFAERHEAFNGASVGELDIAYDRIATWQALPLADGALDARFLEGSRLDEFHCHQFRLRVLSVLLHEINHLVFPSEPESSVRERSIAFYREALASYVDSTVSTMSFTIDRSFSRFG